MNEQQVNKEIDFREIIYVLRKRILVILITSLILSVGVGIYNFYVVESVYESTSKLLVVNQTESTSSLEDMQIRKAMALDSIELIQSRIILDEVIANLKLDMEFEEVLEMLSVSNPTDTRVLIINIENTDANLASGIASELSSVASREIANIMNIEEPLVMEEAKVSNNPIKPERIKNILIAFGVGLFISSLLIIMKYTFFSNESSDVEDKEIVNNMNMEEPIVMEEAEASINPVKHKKTKNILIALGTGLFVLPLSVFIKHTFSKAVKRK